MKNTKKYLKKWIENISKDETKITIKRHIKKHFKEIDDKDYAEWSSSMRNLLDIFDKVHGLKIDTKLRLKKLNDKYLKNPKRYTPPPK